MGQLGQSKRVSLVRPWCHQHPVVAGVEASLETFIGCCWWGQLHPVRIRGGAVCPGHTSVLCSLCPSTLPPPTCPSLFSEHSSPSIQPCTPWSWWGSAAAPSQGMVRSLGQDTSRLGCSTGGVGSLQGCTVLPVLSRSSFSGRLNPTKLRQLQAHP